MYQQSMLFRIKETTGVANHRIIEIFFKAWVDEICNNEVQYTIKRNVNLGSCSDPVVDSRWPEIFRVDFDREEDAVILKLKGIPEEFRNYLEIVN